MKHARLIKTVALMLLFCSFKVIEGFAPAVNNPALVKVDVKVAGESIGKQSLAVKPVRKWEIYILHHSHVDIGYTHVQTEVVRKHWEYFKQVIELARKSANYPAGSRFKWNVEVLWAVESYLKQASSKEREAFVDAVKKGWIGLDALYGNELTALCRPEELIRLVDYAQKLRQRYDLTINSAMITDVPGYTWGIVPVLAQSGVKYFSVGPNRGHRIGYTLSTWGDKPFYWESPSGKRNILCWVAGEGYSLFHSGRLEAGKLFDYLKRLEKSEYPYDMVQLRYSIGGDNGPPDPELSEYVKDWNAKYTYPKLIVATTSEMFDEFEKRYGNQVPKARGDFTPYWEDGAGSSSRELRIIDSIDRVDIINVIDKKKIYKQEGVHLAFPFNVPKGVMRMDTPWAVVRPEEDQLPGACKNYFTVQRWVDVSNKEFGVTWATVDAPLVEIGAITSDPRSKTVGWIKHIKPSTTLYSYVMNNYWETNYKAGQEGPTTFRYSIKPHKRFDSGSAARFGTERSQPLIAVPVDSKIPIQNSILSVKPTSVIVTAFKPSEDGKARIVRLFNASGQPKKARLAWAKPVPKTIWLSNFAEEQVSKITGPIEMTAYEIVTLRVSPR